VKAPTKISKPPVTRRPKRVVKEIEEDSLSEDQSSAEELVPKTKRGRTSSKKLPASSDPDTSSGENNDLSDGEEETGEHESAGEEIESVKPRTARRRRASALQDNPIIASLDNSQTSPLRTEAQMEHTSDGSTVITLPPPSQNDGLLDNTQTTAAVMEYLDHLSRDEMTAIPPTEITTITTENSEEEDKQEVKKRSTAEKAAKRQVAAEKKAAKNLEAAEKKAAKQAAKEKDITSFIAQDDEPLYTTQKIVFDIAKHIDEIKGIVRELSRGNFSEM
jgi:hypothetical protein